MTIKEAVEYLKKIKYKTGTRAYIAESILLPNTINISLHKAVIDVRNGNTETLVTGRNFWLFPDTTYEDLNAWFVFVAVDQEMHEVFEWAKVDGNQIVNPHPEGGDLIFQRAVRDSLTTILNKNIKTMDLLAGKKVL